MTPASALVLYCLLIILASLGGGLVPALMNLTHRRAQVALSFVSGVILGIGVLHLLPEAVAALEGEAAAAADHEAYGHAHGALRAAGWMLGGFLAMFFIERWFCYHHHDPPTGTDAVSRARDHDHDPDHGHALTWSAAAIGLTLHTLVAGIALAAAVNAEDGARLPGFATFLAIVLHKPFDALTIGTLMSVGGRSRRSRHLVNAAFSLAVPLGAVAFSAGVSVAGEPGAVVGVALAFAAGAFLCIALSDLLPELQFHQHDRVALSVALLGGIAVAAAVVALGA